MKISAALWLTGLSALLLSGGWVRAAAPADRGRIEIAYLLEAVAESDCRFFRNGVWYDAARAAAHLRSKYQAMLVRFPAPTAEAFIAVVATRSSMTGLAYQMRCEDGPPQPSSDWLRCKLARFREGAEPGMPCAPGTKRGAQEKGLLVSGVAVTCPA